MKKEVAKIFKKYGEGKITMIKKYKPVGHKETTVAIKGSRMDMNKTMGRLLRHGEKNEHRLVSKALLGDYFEDWDSATREVIKY